jgi:Uma2 family endonuclease
VRKNGVEENTMRAASTPELPPCLPAESHRTLELCFQVPANATRLSGFRAWARSPHFPAHGRISFLDGELFVNMSPEELEHHNKVKEAIDRRIGNLNEQIDAGEFFTDGVLVTNEEANLSTVPDGTFITWESLRSGRVSYVPRKDRQGEFIEIQGSPDWLLEVVSMFSVAKDTKVLPELYHKAKIPEFWLVDARGADISFQILVHQAHGYEAAVANRGWFFSPVFQRFFRLTRQLNPMGRWRYKLAAKKG